jgi:hypothetical protein
MKTGKIMLAVIVMIMALFMIATAQDKPWFDMEKCAFCSQLMAEQGLMDHMPKWEHHNTKTGGMTITVVDPEFVPAYKRAMAKMEEVGMKLQQGEQVYICGYCEAYGALMIQFDQVESDNIFVYTAYSDKPELVDEIHAYIDRTNAEMAKMMETEKGEESD